MKEPCTKCKTILETYIFKKETGIPAYTWHIIACNKCGEYNLLDIEPNVKELGFGNYKWVEQIPKDQFTKEEVMDRINQLKKKKSKT